jgi:prepilin-type N-terminal cleavage/methylation domain-containing protein
MNGYTLVELLIAMLITLVVTAAALSFVAPAHDAFAVQPEAADVQQRIRVGLDALQRDLLMAGAGMYSAGAVGPLHRTIAAVMPYEVFGPTRDVAAGPSFRTDAISVLFVPSTASQSLLSEPLAPGSLDIAIESSPVCPPVTRSQVCGIAAGDSLLIFDRNGEWGVFNVDRIDAVSTRVLLNGHVPTRAFAAHANVTKVEAVSYALKADPSTGASQLVRATAGSQPLPVVDHIVKLEFRYFGDPRPPVLLGGAGETTERRASYGPAPPALDGSIEGWPDGENCTFAVVDGHHQPRLPALSATDDLIELTPSLLLDGPWCPDAGARNRFDADLLRIRRVQFTIRVQTPLATLRGPAGVLFARAGTAGAGQRYVPDMEIQFDVTPRNLNFGR